LDYQYDVIQGEITVRQILITAALAAFCCAALNAADIAAGKDAYEKACKSCHGVDGAPNAGVVKMLKVEIADLKSAEAQGHSDADLKSIITGGKGKMKPSASVTGASVDNVIAYVRSLKK
jgi:mono/diheme cytochrome c family protein